MSTRPATKNGVHPFTFEDFRTPQPKRAAPPAPEPQTAAEPSRNADAAGEIADRAALEAQLRAARDEGFAAGVQEGREAGHAQAMASIAAKDSETLSEIAAAISAWRDAAQKARRADRTAMLETAQAFLTHYCEGLAQTRELEAAADLLSRIIGPEPESGGVTLHLSPRSRAQLGEKLDAFMTMKGVSAMVELAEDPALERGETRLSWRGGDARRTRVEINEAVDALLATFSFDEAAADKQGTEQ